MTACEALCAPIAGGVGNTLPQSATDFGPLFADLRKDPSALLMALRRTKEKAG